MPPALLCSPTRVFSSAARLCNGTLAFRQPLAAAGSWRHRTNLRPSCDVPPSLGLRLAFVAACPWPCFTSLVSARLSSLRYPTIAHSRQYPCLPLGGATADFILGQAVQVLILAGCCCNMNFGSVSWLTPQLLAPHTANPCCTTVGP